MLVEKTNIYHIPSSKLSTHKMCIRDRAMMPDMMNQVLERFQPLASRAKEAGLILGFENCGQTPDEVISILKALDVPGWGMAWDPANYFDVLPEAKGDCISYFTKALQYTCLLYTSRCV